MSLKRDDIQVLLTTHASKALELTTTNGLSGAVHWNGSPRDLVDELLRLAHVGAHAEQLATASPRSTVTSAVREASAWWTNQGMFLLGRRRRAV